SRQILGRQTSLPQDGAKSAAGQDAIPVDGHDHEATGVRLAQVVVATPNVRDSEASTLERLQDILAAGAGQTGHAIAISRSTSSASESPSRTSSPSLAAASR